MGSGESSNGRQGRKESDVALSMEGKGEGTFTYFGYFKDIPQGLLWGGLLEKGGAAVLLHPLWICPSCRYSNVIVPVNEILKHY